MSIPLAEELQEVELEAGQTYRCQVKGHWIELRVLGPHSLLSSAAFPESDMMLDAWIELPNPPALACRRSKFGQLNLPDSPEIPQGEEA